MTASIIILSVLLILFVLCRVVLRRRVKDIITSGSLRFFIGLVVVLLIMYLNRYSLLAMPVLIHSGHSFGEAVSEAFTLNNDLPFFVDLMRGLCIEKDIEMPKYLDKSLINLVEGESDFVNSVGDILELILLVW